MERINSGIKGLEKLVGGGIPRGHSTLICGTPGTGKTIFGLQFLYMGAKKFNENGLYVSIEEHPRKLRKYGAEFGWKDIEALEKAGKLQFLHVAPTDKKFDIVDKVREQVTRMNAKRLVVDSLSSIYMAFEDITQFVYSFVGVLEELGVTSIFITDSPSAGGGDQLTKDGVSEFVCDGVIQLQLNDVSKTVSRTLSIKKMRGTEITPGQNILRISKAGLEIEEYKAFY